MIAKIKTRADFGGIVNYANDQKEQEKRVLHFWHMKVFVLSTIKP